MRAAEATTWVPQERPVDPETIRESAMARILGALLQDGELRRDDSLLIVFAGEFDRAVLSHLGFTNVTLANISSSVGDAHFDAAQIPCADASFDHVLAHAGIHHSSRPHQSVCEMYRVARRSVMFFEAQDSWMMRLAIRLNLTQDYEWNGILDHGLRRGGVDDRPIPNYVYRWTPREVEKLVRSLDPAHVPFIHFDISWDFTYQRVQRRLQRTPLRVLPSWLMAPICQVSVAAFNLLLSRYGNVFFARIQKRGVEQPWMKDGIFITPVRVVSTGDAPRFERS